jgi:hypothetical protein
MTNVATAITAQNSTNPVTAVANGLMTTNQFYALPMSPTMRSRAGRPQPMVAAMQCWQSESRLIQFCQYMRNNGLIAAGWRTLSINESWTTNRSNASTNGGNFAINTNLYPLGWGHAVSNCATYGIGLWPADEAWPTGHLEDKGGFPSITPESAYNDGLQLASMGIKGFALNGAPMSTNQYQYVVQAFAAGLDDGVILTNQTQPIYLLVNPDISVLSTEIRWLPEVANMIFMEPYGDWSGPTVTSTNWAACLAYSLTNQPALITPQCGRNAAILTAYDGAWVTTNLVRAAMGIGCVAHWQLGIVSIDAMSLTSTELSVLTNAAAININQDPLASPTQITFLNPTNWILSSVLNNGDLALGFWNLSTNATASMTAGFSNYPSLFGYPVQSVVDVFDGSITGATNSLTATVNTRGFNLYRLSRPLSAISALTTNITSGTNVFTFVNGLLQSYGPPPGPFYPTNVPGAELFFSYLDLATNVGVTAWTNEVGRTVFTNFWNDVSTLLPTNTALGVCFSNANANTCAGFLNLGNNLHYTNSTDSMWIRFMVAVQPGGYPCLIGLTPGPTGLYTADTGGGQLEVDSYTYPLSRTTTNVWYDVMLTPASSSTVNVYTNGTSAGVANWLATSSGSFHGIATDGTDGSMQGYIQFIQVNTNHSYSGLEMTNMINFRPHP